MSQPELLTGIPDSELPGPYPVGAYAAQLKQRLREFARVQLVGEVWSFPTARARVYFELRDARGALPCSMWRSEFEQLGVTLTDGLRIVVGGGCDYYPAAPPPRPPSASRSPSCAWRARATCWSSSSGCAVSSRPTGCSNRRSGWRAPCCRARSGW